jgi:hypothetical protein
MQLVGVVAPVVRVQRAQAGLLVNRVEGALGLPGERVGPAMVSRESYMLARKSCL